MLDTCLGCGMDLSGDEIPCPECGWDIDDFRERGRHGLADPGHGEPGDSDGEDRTGSGGGPPPGTKGLFGF